MTNTTPIQQPPVEDLRNALQIAVNWGELPSATGSELALSLAVADIARLVRHALDQLGEPSLACVQATATLMREFNGDVTVESRYFRDTAAVILNAQMTGEIPPTWETP